MNDESFERNELFVSKEEGFCERLRQFENTSNIVVAGSKGQCCAYFGGNEIVTNPAPCISVAE